MTGDASVALVLPSETYFRGGLYHRRLLRLLPLRLRAVELAAFMRLAGAG